MPGSSKAEWLEKALKAMPGKAKVQDVFNIITHPKFSSGVAEKYGKRMLQTVAESMDLFSDKQRITLSRCKLVELFQLGGAGEAKDDDSGDETPPEAPKMPKRRKRSRSRSQKRRSPSPAKKPAKQSAVSPSRGVVCATAWGRGTKIAYVSLMWILTGKRDTGSRRRKRGELKSKRRHSKTAKRRGRPNLVRPFSWRTRMTQRMRELSLQASSADARRSFPHWPWLELPRAMGGDKLLQEAGG
ncbi:unnamed protein product [Symbiodinium sp. CCMP2456]|nr:unnamed protein product [Symbiodinium sp. CCMP2456]